jgi:hypothetical protein
VSPLPPSFPSHPLRERLRLRQEALHKDGGEKAESPVPVAEAPTKTSNSDSDGVSDAGGGDGSDSDSDSASSLDKINSFVKGEKSFFDSALSDEDEDRDEREAKKTITAAAPPKIASKLSPAAPSAMKFATKTFDSDSEDDEESGGDRGGGAREGSSFPKSEEEKEDLVMSFDDDFDD